MYGVTRSIHILKILTTNVPTTLHWLELLVSSGNYYTYIHPRTIEDRGLFVCISAHSTTQLDRQWEYQCGAGSNNLANVVSTVCTLQV